MEVEKRGAKGSFFQLFDWNGKSRKKLFSGKSDFPESSNQGKENYHDSVISRHQQGLEKGLRGQNDHHYSSPANNDSEYVTKAPGVVARLMGLDSLPTTKNNNEHSFTPFIEPHSFRDNGHLISAPPFQNEHDIVIFESVRNKLDGLSRNPLDLRVQKMQSRHLERFQSEMLPPKSTKPFPISHNRLLSPIKSPGFVPPKNAAYIIEAAAKIIEQSPRSTAKVNYPSLSSSSSIPFRARDMKEKMEASQRASRSADVAYQRNKDQNPMNNSKKYLNNANKGKSLSEENCLYNGPQRLKSKEKSASLAVQAKTNVQKRDGIKQKGLNDVRNVEKKFEKKKSSTKRQSEVLKVNNQKQNRAFTEDEENSGPSCSHTKERKESNLPTNNANGRMNRNVNKIVVNNNNNNINNNNNVVTSRKTNFVAADSGKELPSSRAKSKKKMPVDGNNNNNNNNQAGNTVTMRDEKSMNCNVEFEFDSKWDEFDKKTNSLDVVSFTFTSPIKKSGAGSRLFAHESDIRNSTASSSGFSLIGGDALSVLLEQKLKELTSKVEMSQMDFSEGGSVSYSGNGYENVNPSIVLLKSMHVDHNTCKSKREIQYDSDCSYIDEHGVKAGKEKKELAYIERYSDNINIDTQGPSLSNQPSLSFASSDSFDIYRHSSNEATLPFNSLGSCEGMNMSSTMKSHPAESDVEISDTASSLSVGFMSETINSSSFTLDSKDSSSNWELQYIVDILTSGELLLEEFALGQSHKVIAPDLFDELENKKLDSYKDAEEENMLERKVLFDCVCECLELKCRKLLVGSSELWVKQMTLLKRRRVLADEMYREIMSWTNVEEMMVDEVVEKDMSCNNGKWTDFEVEAFEEGLGIEERILTCLVDELIDDFLL